MAALLFDCVKAHGDRLAFPISAPESNRCSLPPQLCGSNAK